MCMKLPLLDAEHSRPFKIISSLFVPPINFPAMGIGHILAVVGFSYTSFVMPASERDGRTSALPIKRCFDSN